MNSSIIGTPRIIIPHAIYEKCMGWMKATSDEVSWRGLADWNEKDFRITEVFLPIQKASGAHVEVPTAQEGGDFGKWLTDCIRKGVYQNSRKECRYKWHMHKHPGLDWGSLFESTTDENNTAKFGVRDIKWMMVGRAVDTGKFRVCLEVFQPFRIGIDFLPVFVEYNGLLYKVSEPNKSPEVEGGGLKFSFAEASLLFNIQEGKKYFARVELKEREAPTYPAYSGYVAGGHNSYHPYQPSHSNMRLSSKIVEIVAISETPTDSQIQCVLEKIDGTVFAQVEIKVADWNLKIQKMPLQINLPELPEVRAEAEKEVKEKVSSSYSYVTWKGENYLRLWQKNRGEKGRFKSGLPLHRTTETEKEDEENTENKEVSEDGGSTIEISRLPEAGADQIEFPDYDYRNWRDW